MNNKDDKRLISDAEALHLIEDGEYVHTLRSAGNVLLGGDVSRIRLIQVLEEFCDTIEIAGELARSLGHGVVVIDQTGPLFIKTNVERLNAFDPLPGTI